VVFVVVGTRGADGRFRRRLSVKGAAGPRRLQRSREAFAGHRVEN
jgi:hypothetical protein